MLRKIIDPILIFVFQAIALLLLIMLKPILAHGQGTITTTKPKSVEKKQRPIFSALVNLEKSSNQFDSKSGNQQSATNLTLAPSVSLTENLNLGASSIVTKQDTSAQETTLSNTLLILGYNGYKFSNGAQLAHSLRTTLPTNEDQKKTDRFQGAVGVRNQITAQLGGLDFTYRLTLTKNIHEFTRNADGQENIEYTLSHLIEPTYNFNDYFAIGYVAAIRQSKTYSGSDRNMMSSDLDFYINFTKKFQVNFGASTDGTMYKANGTDSNVEIYNSNKSSLKAGLTLLI